MRIRSAILFLIVSILCSASCNLLKKLHEKEMAARLLDPEPYKDSDSLQQIVKKLKDSVDSYYNGHLFRILQVRGGSGDTINVYPGCYCRIGLKGGLKIYGVIDRITGDSLFISNEFNQTAAEKRKINYQIFRLPLSDLDRLYLIRKDKMGFRKIKLNENTFVVKWSEIPENRRSFYEYTPDKGEVKLFRWGPVEWGYYPFLEKEGVVYFY